jgi:tRNA modification GTPase
VAVSTGWEPAPLGVARLSGSDCAVLLRNVSITLPNSAGPVCNAAQVHLDARTTLPATIFWFPAPRSYTGQDVVEIHTIGCLPWLRELCARLIEAGARRALPGEFTARALRTGRLDPRQAAGVLALLQSTDEAQARRAARQAHSSQRKFVADVGAALTSLLARIEAGIDFADEEDVRFVEPREVVQSLDSLLSQLQELRGQPPQDERAARPHVALVGRPNAGKSTLFNALLGYERALVSPVLGTTRDVLSAELSLGGVVTVLQDCAGLGDSADELALATHLATEQAAAQADLVLWVHAADTTWDACETAACASLPAERRVLVCSKMDAPAPHAMDHSPLPFAARVEVSAPNGTGIEELRMVLAQLFRQRELVGGVVQRPGELGVAWDALQRARALAAASVGPQLSAAELVALELRAAHAALADTKDLGLEEKILDRIFAQFCVGK